MGSMTVWSFIKDLIREQFMPLPTPTTPLTNKTIIITGSNRGLGLGAATWFTHLNAKTVILAVRNVQKGILAKEKILKKTKGMESTTEILVWELDLSSFSSIRSFAQRCTKELSSLDALVLNAAVLTETWRTSVDGWESSLQINTLSAAYLSLLLYPLLLSASTDGSIPHISIVSSDLYHISPFHERHQPRILNYLNNPENYDKYMNPLSPPTFFSRYDFSKILDRYKISKLLVIYITRSLATLGKGQGKIIVNALNPGFAPTHAGDEVYTGVKYIGLRISMALLARSIKSASRTLVFASTAECGMETNGEFMSSCRIKSTGKFVIGEEGPEIQAKVWNEVGEILKEQSPELAEFFE